MLPHLERKLGPDHPDTLAAAEWIANIRYGPPAMREYAVVVRRRARLPDR
jgi:hypothetical protein